MSRFKTLNLVGRAEMVQLRRCASFIDSVSSSFLQSFFARFIDCFNHGLMPESLIVALVDGFIDGLVRRLVQGLIRLSSIGGLAYGKAPVKALKKGKSITPGWTRQ